MAGHSKWANIRHTKSKNDAKRGKLFTKINRIISVAVKEGGADPSMNAALRDAIDKAKQNNVPNSNIERTIKKSSGNLDGDNYEKVIYEGYGISGTAVIVYALTDNKNRTTASIRHIFDKYGGSLGTSGSSSYLFEKKGIVIISLENLEEKADDIMDTLLEKNIEDVEFEKDNCSVVVDPKDFREVVDFIKEKKWPIINSSVDLIPNTEITLDRKGKESFTKMLEKFDEDDDVQEVYHNVENI